MSDQSNESPKPNGGNVRTAKEVIDGAIAENRIWERVCLTLTLLFPFVGIGILVMAVVRGDGLMALAGSISSSLFWPALRSAIAIRQVNIAIRLLEVPLSQAKSSSQALNAINQAFATHFGTGRQNVAD